MRVTRCEVVLEAVEHLRLLHGGELRSDEGRRGLVEEHCRQVRSQHVAVRVGRGVLEDLCGEGRSAPHGDVERVEAEFVGELFGGDAVVGMVSDRGEEAGAQADRNGPVADVAGHERLPAGGASVVSVLWRWCRRLPSTTMAGATSAASRGSVLARVATLDGGSRRDRLRTVLPGCQGR